MADKTEKIKKRKREDTNGSSKPSKKVAIERDPQITLSHQDTTEWAPIIASTPGVDIPTSIALKAYKKTRRNVAPKTRGDIATKELLLHSSEHPQLDYIAREEEAGGEDTLLKHYIGVYDPETGKMEIVEARKMVVRGSVRAQQASAQDEALPTNIRDRRNALGETFGTKKARKAIASVTENAIGPDRAARRLPAGERQKLDSTASAVLSTMGGAVANIASSDELRKRIDEAKPRPRANENAHDIKDVYTVDSLIGLETFKTIPILEWQQTVKAGKEVIVNSKYVANRIRPFASSPEKLKVLRYILLLIEFYNATIPGKGGRRLKSQKEVRHLRAFQLPEPVQESVQRKFSEGREMKKWNSDYLLTHICALACLVDNYEVDFWDLKNDLAVDTKQMGIYFMEIGAKIGPMSETEQRRQGLEKAAAAQRKIAKLKIPLAFPKQSLGKARGR